MTNTCPTCKQVILTRSQNTIRKCKVNSELWEAGKIYWDTMTLAMQAVSNALDRNGYALPDDWVYGRDNRVLHVEVGSGVWLSVSMYRMPSGRYELVAYVN